jgi:hypothetical protein
MECGFLKRKGYNDYKCRATNESISYDWYNNICTTSMYLTDCDDYRKHCYVSTMIFDMLGKCEKCEERTMIAKLRMYASQNPDLGFILDIYDSIGPQIASAIKNENDCCEVYGLYSTKLNPICNDIKNNNYDVALIKYFRLIKNLSKKYSDSIDMSNCVINDDNKAAYIQYRKSIKKNVNV